MLSYGRNVLRKSFQTYTGIISTRSFSYQSDYVTASVIPETKIATLKMHNPPVNCMSLEFIHDFIEAFRGIEKSDCRAVIIASNFPKVFCAGLDFTEIVKPKQERLLRYWKCFDDIIVTVYSSKLATVSAINGAAPAGGCVLATATDYRVILQDGTIGLNEVAIGLPLHSWIVQMTANVTGWRNAELAGLTGELYTAEKALKLGFVDEIAVDKKDLWDKVEKQARLYADLPDMNSFHATKLEGRQPIIDLIKSRKYEGGIFLECVNSASTQNVLSAYANKLKKK
ncbi:dodecenoyl-CoA isomerase [Chamberlinius hualienensis]